MVIQDVPLHQVRGLVRGANWRVTKFAAAVPPLLCCGLCQVVSNTTFLLPCFHNLCGTCLSNSSNGGNAVCPFEEQSFAVRDCQELPSSQDVIDNLKACCWNESHGCKFVGTFQDVLTHYEDHCTFHVVPCTLCNGRVVQTDLPKHYRAGCRSEPISFEPEQLNLHEGHTLGCDIMLSSLDQLKALIMDPCQDRLPALQSTLNEILEDSRIIRGRIDGVFNAVTDNQTRLSQALGELSATFFQQLQPQLHNLSARIANMCDVGRSKASEAGAKGTTGLMGKREKTHILRRLEVMASDSHAYLEVLRQRSDKQLQEPLVDCKTVFPSASSAYASVGTLPLMGRLDCKDHGYYASLTNIGKLLNSDELVGLFTRWYRRDGFLQVAAKGCHGRSMFIYLKFGRTLQGPPYPPIDADVRVIHPQRPGEQVVLGKAPTGDLTKPALCGFQFECFVDISCFVSLGFIKDDKMALIISFKN